MATNGEARDALAAPARGDMVVSGYGLVHHIKDVHCDHLVTVDDYYETLTRAESLEFAGFVPVWRKKDDHCGSDNVPAGGSLHLVGVGRAAPPAGLRAWIAALPDDACRQVVNAYRDAHARAYTDSHAAGFVQQHVAGCAAVRDALLSLAPKEEP